MISSLLFMFYLLFQQSAEKCVTTLLDLIQNKINYVVQEAIIVLKVKQFYWIVFGHYKTWSEQHSHIGRWL